jgi:hypothetical protein
MVVVPPEEIATSLLSRIAEVDPYAHPFREGADNIQRRLNVIEAALGPNASKGKISGARRHLQYLREEMKGLATYLELAQVVVKAAKDSE